MQTTESSVLLTDGPRLAIEFDFHGMLCVSPIVVLVLDHIGRHDADCQWDLEEVRSDVGTLFGATLHMVNEDL